MYCSKKVYQINTSYRKLRKDLIRKKHQMSLGSTNIIVCKYMYNLERNLIII